MGDNSDRSFNTRNVELPDTIDIETIMLKGQQTLFIDSNLTRELILTLENSNPITVEVFDKTMEAIRESLRSYLTYMSPSPQDCSNIIGSLFDGYSNPLYDYDSIANYSPVNAVLMNFFEKFRVYLSIGDLQGTQVNFDRSVEEAQKMYSSFIQNLNTEITKLKNTPGRNEYLIADLEQKIRQVNSCLSLIDVLINTYRRLTVWKA